MFFDVKDALCAKPSLDQVRATARIVAAGFARTNSVGVARSVEGHITDRIEKKVHSGVWVDNISTSGPCMTMYDGICRHYSVYRDVVGLMYYAGICADMSAYVDIIPCAEIDVVGLIYYAEYVPQCRHMPILFRVPRNDPH